MFKDHGRTFLWHNGHKVFVCHNFCVPFSIVYHEKEISSKGYFAAPIHFRNSIWPPPYDSGGQNSSFFAAFEKMYIKADFCLLTFKAWRSIMKPFKVPPCLFPGTTMI